MQFYLHDWYFPQRSLCFDPIRLICLVKKPFTKETNTLSRMALSYAQVRYELVQHKDTEVNLLLGAVISGVCSIDPEL
jgi:hypothetical protein